MKKITTLALTSALAAASLSAQAQITLDGTISEAEIGTGTGKYTSLGAFTTPHVGDAGFGFFGLLRMYGANTNNKLYVGLAGSIEPGGNNFQLYMDLPNRTGVPVGTALPVIAGSTTVFGSFGTNGANTIGGTKLELEADAAIATTGSGDVQAAIYTATTGTAKSLGDGLSSATTNDGTPSTIGGAQTTGTYSLFAGTRVAYKQPTGNLTTNPGNANGGGAGSLALEYEFDRAAMGLPSGASVVRLFAAYVSGDAFWSSDIIPETAGDGTNTGGNRNIGFRPDFTDQVKFPGTQAATLNVVITSTRKADDAVVAMSVFPNPSEGESTITYRVQGGAQAVAVQVTDLLGRHVRTLLAGQQRAGFHDLKVATGDLAAGTYLVRVQVGDKVATRRLAVTR